MRGEGRAAVPAGGRGPYPFCRKEKGAPKTPEHLGGRGVLGVFAYFLGEKCLASFLRYFVMRRLRP